MRFTESEVLGNCRSRVLMHVDGFGRRLHEERAALLVCLRERNDCITDVLLPRGAHGEGFRAARGRSNRNFAACAAGQATLCETGR